jgi:osmotically-inducible protein OsmY
MIRKLASAACSFTLCGAFLLPVSVEAGQNRAPDNTAVNKQDRNANSPTADQAKNNRSDTDLMKNIRHDVVNDKSLSSYGHNVKIVASHGRVTLKGPVHTAEEKQAIEEHARRYAGDGNIDNQMTVKNDRK